VPWRRGIRSASSLEDSQLADLIYVSNFELRIHDTKPRSFDRIADSELLFGMAHSKFGIGPIECTRDPEQVTQIGMTSFIEGSGESDSGLHPGDDSEPGNFAVQHSAAALRLRWAFDTTLHNVAAIDSN
jgi:hypothetical protein